MERDREMSLIRGLNFVFSVFLHLQHDPFCRNCALFVESFETAREKFLSLEKILYRSGVLPEEMKKMFLDISSILAHLDIPDTPHNQKHEGYCDFPDKICLAKSIISVYEDIEGRVFEVVSGV